MHESTRARGGEEGFGSAVGYGSLPLASLGSSAPQPARSASARVSRLEPYAPRSLFLSFWTELAMTFMHWLQLGAHEDLAVVAVCEERVVCMADQAQVFGGGSSAPRVRHAVVQFQKPALRAALAISTHERALPLVALVHLTPDRSWDVASVHLVRRLDRPLGCAGLSEALLQRVFDQAIHRTFDDHSQVSVWHLMTQQVLELLQLVMQRLSRRELQLVPARTERFRRGSVRRRFQREGCLAGLARSDQLRLCDRRDSFGRRRQDCRVA